MLILCYDKLQHSIRKGTSKGTVLTARVGQLCQNGVQGTPEGVEDNGSLTRVAAFPIGIDPERFQRALERVDVRSNIAELLNRYAGRKVREICAINICDHNDNRTVVLATARETGTTQWMVVLATARETGTT